MYVGKIGNTPVSISTEAPNQSVLLTGISGSGKTCRMNQMELDMAREDTTVLILDMNHAHSMGQIYPPIAQAFEQMVNRISGLNDGVAVNFLLPIGNESYFNLINAALTTLAEPFRLGMIHRGILREAIIFAVQHRGQFEDEMSAICYGLLQQEKKDADVVYQRLWPILKCGIFRRSDKGIKQGRINVIDVSGVDVSTQAVIVQTILAYLWRIAIYGKNFGGKFLIVIDEVQNLLLKRDSVLCDMLREGRKFGFSFLMATQTMDIFSKEVISILGQASTRLYFRPADKEIRNISQQIGRISGEDWDRKISTLDVGSSVAMGKFQMGGRNIVGPLLLK